MDNDEKPQRRHVEWYKNVRKQCETCTRVPNDRREKKSKPPSLWLYELGSSGCTLTKLKFKQLL